MQYINREISDKINTLAEKFPVIAITGPRQSGKTTLAKHIFPKHQYVSLEDPDIREFAMHDPRSFLHKYSNNTIIDEIQRVPSLFSYIQTIVDEHQKPGEFILTGSQNILLTENISQTLAGRVAFMTLLPFNISELSSQFGLKEYGEYLFKGFFPRIYDFQIDPTDWYPNYIDTYIERDLRQMKNISNLYLFKKFIHVCAANCGQIVNLSAIANDCGISYNTVNSWLGILETSCIIFLLKPHYQNYNKRIIKMPKLYFCDTGIACSLLGIKSTEQLDNYYQKGALFENLIITELLKMNYNLGKKDNLFYWRDSKGHEIDIIIENDLRLIPVEVKSAKTINKAFFKNLIYYCSLANIPVKDSVLIYGGDENQEREAGKILSYSCIQQILQKENI